MSKSVQESVLICDIGGTNVRLGIYTEGQKDLVSFDGKYKCAEFTSFEDVVKTYFSEHTPKHKPQLCVIGAAGDIDEKKGKILATNTPWRADIDCLKKNFPFIKEARLVNDFALQGWALSDMTSEQYLGIFNAEKPADFKNEKIVVVGPGTGLGTCLLFSDKNGERVVYTSEAGHSTIPHVMLNNQKDNKINKKVLKTVIEHYKGKGQRAITEHIISGTGISNIYHAIKDGVIPTNKKMMVPAEKIEDMAARGNAVALKTFDIFNAYLGAHAGTMVATTKADTVFLCGGLMASSWVMFRLHDTSYFMDQFIPRAGLTETMNRVGIYASTYRDMSTLGAVVYAKDMIQKQKGNVKNGREKQDILKTLYYLQSFVDMNCPKVKKSMQRVARAVQHIQKKENTRV